MKIRPCVFICGLITPRGEGNHAIEFLTNISKGIVIAARLIKNGFAVYCPMTDLFYWLTPEDPPSSEDIYEHDLSILRKMDAIYTVGDWTKSPNCKREFELAWELNIPCFENIDIIKSWKEEVWNDKL